jgi:hypothetical protein
MQTILNSLLLFLLLSSNLKFTYQSLPPCGLYKDTYGSWKSTKGIDKNPMAKKEIEQHFYHGGPGESTKFSNVWLPTGCSYHRFTKETLHKCSEHLINDSILNNKELTENRTEIVFLGDSATRGVFCGICRLFGGSEWIGPLKENGACGGGGYGNPASSSKYGQFENVDFDNIRLTFVYIKTYYIRHFDWILEWSVTNVKPYAVIVNTGAWDFDEIARTAYLENETAPLYCTTDATRLVEESRNTPFVNDTFRGLGRDALNNNIRVIYRNNHFNKRFGVYCADEKFEKMIDGSNWEIWDNRRISKDNWRKQDWDGFHFDRHKIYSVEQHLSNIFYYNDTAQDFPGELEMQLAQSLLNSVFHDCLFNHIQKVKL